MEKISRNNNKKNSNTLFTTFHSPTPTTASAMTNKRLSASSTDSPTSITDDISPNKNSPPALLSLQELSSELSQESQESQQQEKEQYRVRFFSKVTVIKTLSHKSMSKKEKCNYWLQEDEFVLIKQRNDTMIQQINNDIDDDYSDYQGNSQSSLLSFTKSSVHYGHQHYDDEDEDEDCKRGLEYGLKVEAIRKRSSRYLALEEVLIKQEEQYLSGSGSFNDSQSDYFIYDDEAIADAYYTISYECQHRAHRIAIQDRKEIEYYIHDGTKLTGRCGWRSGHGEHESV